MNCRQDKNIENAFSLHMDSVGSGDAVVLLHPVGLDGTCWEPIARQLSQRFRVIMPDLRGFGGSRDHPAANDMDDYAYDVMKTLQEQGIERFSIIGLSFGGMVAQRVAILFADAVRSLVSAGCGCTFPPEVRTILAQRGRSAEQSGMAAIVDETMNRWFSADFIASGKADHVRTILNTVDPIAWSHAWQGIAGLDNQAALGALTIPALCVAGEKDPAAPPAMVQIVADAIPGAGFAMLPNAVHMMQIENPDLFGNAISSFLETLPKA